MSVFYNIDNGHNSLLDNTKKKSILGMQKKSIVGFLFITKNVHNIKQKEKLIALTSKPIV